MSSSIPPSSAYSFRTRRTMNYNEEDKQYDDNLQNTSDDSDQDEDEGKDSSSRPRSKRNRVDIGAGSSSSHINNIDADETPGYQRRSSRGLNIDSNSNVNSNSNSNSNSSSNATRRSSRFKDTVTKEDSLDESMDPDSQNSNSIRRSSRFKERDSQSLSPPSSSKKGNSSNRKNKESSSSNNELIGGLRRSSRQLSKSSQDNNGDNSSGSGSNDDDEEEDEEDDDDNTLDDSSRVDGKKRYSFRNRNDPTLKRDFFNPYLDNNMEKDTRERDERNARRGSYEDKNDNKDYYLRKSKEKPNYSFPRLNIPRESSSSSRRRSDRSGSGSHKRHHRHRRSSNSSHSIGFGGKRKHFDSSSESDSSSSSDNSKNSGYNSETDQFNRHEAKRLEHERDSIQPIDLRGSGMGMSGSVVDKVNKRDIGKADAAPVAVDSSIDFDAVGGLDDHIRSLKEMIVFPLLYPDVFVKFDAQPPRGVLFVGPPGTGKTLTARALCNSLSTSINPNGQKISFFMRKGADCLSKWVGEGERQLRLLFEQAKKMQPSIIFFDEIDGLAPVRSAKQDQIHSSIVSTLLALMDGLDSRGQVVVIGATNRPDAIDPALRRPGRFDRELLFPLPDAKARHMILDIHTKKWEVPLKPEIKDWIVNQTSGYCGADLKAFCAEAALISLRRTFPQVYESNARLQLDHSKLSLALGDFAAALRKIVPSSRRSAISKAKPLEGILKSILTSQLSVVEEKITVLFPPLRFKSMKPFNATSCTSRDEYISRGNSFIVDSSHVQNDIWMSFLTDVSSKDLSSDSSSFAVNSDGVSMDSGFSSSSSNSIRSSNVGIDSSLLMSLSRVGGRPRMLIAGKRDMGQDQLAPAALHILEAFPVFSIDITTLLGDSYVSSPEQALVQKIEEACKSSPSILYLPNVTGWWQSASENLKLLICSIIESFPVDIPVFWLSSLSYEGPASSSLEENEDSMAFFNSPQKSERQAISDQRLGKLVSWLSNYDVSSGKPSLYKLDQFHLGSNAVVIQPPSESIRKTLFSGFAKSLYELPGQLYESKKLYWQSYSSELNKDLQPIVAPQSDSSVAMSVNDAMNNSPIDVERERQCHRELRTFFRACLAEIHKEKRTLVFWRPVDPDMVPDYYDIISYPMDLETMRMKVDDELYPTLDFFLRDINQIIFNAKEYNPMDLKDSRGRSIVHAAHMLTDLVESHAYFFKKKLGYDIFKRCDEIARKRGIKPPKPPHSKQKLPISDQKFYAKTILLHFKIKEDVEDEDIDRLFDAYFDHKSIVSLESILRSSINSSSSSNNRSMSATTPGGKMPSLSSSSYEYDVPTRRSARGKTDDVEFVALDFVPRRKSTSSSSKKSEDSGGGSQDNSGSGDGSSSESAGLNSNSDDFIDATSSSSTAATLSSASEEMSIVEVAPNDGNHESSAALTVESIDAIHMLTSDIDKVEALSSSSSSSFFSSSSSSSSSSAAAVSFAVTSNSAVVPNFDFHNNVSVDDFPVMISHRLAMERAKRSIEAGDMGAFVGKLMRATEQSSTTSLVELMSVLNQLVKRFLNHLDWNVLVSEIDSFLSSSLKAAASPISSNR